MHFSTIFLVQDNKFLIRKMSLTIFLTKLKKNHKCLKKSDTETKDWKKESPGLGWPRFLLSTKFYRKTFFFTV